jgi:multiple sugar transport system permease protein
VTSSTDTRLVGGARLAATVRGAAEHPRRRLLLRVLPEIALVYVGLAVMCVFILFPFVYVVGTSLRSGSAYSMLTYPPTIFPAHPSLDNYWRILTELPVARWYLNSTIMAIGVTAGEVFFCALTGYTFAKRNFPFKNLLFAGTMATLMIPAGLTFFPAYLITRSLGLLDTHAGLILPGIPSAFGVFMLRQFMQSIPDELIDAGRIDGASEFGIFWRIVIPISTPGLAALGILAMNWSWNLLLWPLVVGRSKDMITLTVGLANMTTEFNVHYGLLSAAVFLAVAPLIVGFLFFQRYFVAGLVAGATKG